MTITQVKEVLKNNFKLTDSQIQIIALLIIDFFKLNSHKED